MEKEQSLLLECRFHSVCSSVRLLGNELRNIRSCLMQELLQIEEKKNVKLNEELRAFKHKQQNKGESKARIREQSDGEGSNTCTHEVSFGTVEDQPILPSQLSERSYTHCRIIESNPDAALTGNSIVLDAPTGDYIEVAEADKSYSVLLVHSSEEEYEVIVVDKVEKDAERSQLMTTSPLAVKGGKKTTEATLLSNREIVKHYKGCKTQGKIMGKALRLQLKRVKFEEEKQERTDQVMPRVHSSQSPVCKSKGRVSSLQTPFATASTKLPLLSSGPVSFHGACCNLRYPKRTMESMKSNLCAADQASSPLKASLNRLGSSPVLSDCETSPEIPMQDTSPIISLLVSNSLNASRRTLVNKKGKVLKLNTSREDKPDTKSKERSTQLGIEGSSKSSDGEHTSVMNSSVKQGGNKQPRRAWKKKERVKSNKRAETMGREGVGLSTTTLDNPRPSKKRRTLFGSAARVNLEVFEHSVTKDEVHLERSTSIRMNTSNLIAPKLKKTPFMRT